MPAPGLGWVGLRLLLGLGLSSGLGLKCYLGQKPMTRLDVGWEQVKAAAWVGSKVGGEFGTEIQLGPVPSQEIARALTWPGAFLPHSHGPNHPLLHPAPTVPERGSPQYRISPAPPTSPTLVTYKRYGGLTPRSCGQPRPQGEERLEPEVERVVPGGAGPGEAPEPVCPLVQVVLTWHLPLPGLWTVNRDRTGVGTRAELGGGGGHNCPCSSQRKGSPGLSPLHPHTPTTLLFTAPLGGVQARRGWGAVHSFPSAPPPFHSLSLDFPELLVSPNIPGRDQRGRFSALAQRVHSAARLPSSGPGRVALLGIKSLKDQEHKARRQEVAEGSPPWAQGSDFTKPLPWPWEHEPWSSCQPLR